MPPFIPKKRLASTPPPSPKPAPIKKARLADALDAESRRTPKLPKNTTFSLGSDGSDSSLSDVDSDQFEDVRPVVKQSATKLQDHSEDDEDEDIEWEDAEGQQEEPKPAREPLADGDIQLVFSKGDEVIDYGTAATASSGKKGPTKREKEARIRTHQMHVQFLLWHNFIRNRWASDRVVQQSLVSQLPPPIRSEVEKWRRASGLPTLNDKKKSPAAKKRKGGKHKGKPGRDDRNWSKPNQRLESGRADMSRGDPLISLLKVLAAYWKKRFAITAPGLRKRGYTTKQGLKQDIASFRNEEHDPEKHGERVRDIKEFREVAQKCEGSRDLGAQLFTALLRGLGIESRMVASLQPSGYGWTKAEQAVPRKLVKPSTVEESSEDSDELDTRTPLAKVASKKPTNKTRPGKTQPRKNTTGNKGAPIDLDASSDDGADIEIKDDVSLVDVTPSLPKKRIPRYDREVPFPIYWVEAISPITNKVLPVSPLVVDQPVASTPEALTYFEPRGQKAERAKIVMAYVVAYSSDGTAKDVTVRYLKKRVWPGKTKGFRLPLEKLPVYDKHGRVKRYQDYDWFKHVMSSYARTDLMRTVVDDIEDATDLVPQLPEKKEVKDEGDTLQNLKTSADFVLERFLRREEALRPGAEPDRYFVSGKGNDLKEEPVYHRSDVERCLTAESWRREGREPKVGEAPMKLVPVRAVTLTRKREAEEHLRTTGEKQMQGLYSCDQTEYIIPPPIENGIIPKNAYGNIDCFVPSMVPKGAVHIPYRGLVKICKKLDIDFAEAVTGFEFGNKRAVPVAEGVVVPVEHEQMVIDEWKRYNEEQRKKDETKMEKLVLDLWRKFVVGLRIRERVQETYGEELDKDEPNILSRERTKDEPIDIDAEEEVTADMTAQAVADDDMGGGFLLPHEDDIPEPEDLVMEHHDPVPKPTKRQKGKGIEQAHYPTPTSLSSRPTKNTQRKTLLPESEEEDEDEDEVSDVESGSDGQDDTDNDGRDSSVQASLGGDQNSKQLNVGIKVSKGRSVIRSLSQKHKPVSDSGTDDDFESTSNLNDDVSGDHSSSDSGSDSEDEYTPKKPRSNPKLKPRQSNKAAPQARNDKSAKPTPRRTPRTTKTTKAKSESTPKRSRRVLRRDSTLVTSPYFDGDTTG